MTVMEKVLKIALFISALTAGLYFGGKMDREEYAIVNMSQSEYDGIRDSLRSINGSTPSDGMITDVWYQKKGE